MSHNSHHITLVPYDQVRTSFVYLGNVFVGTGGVDLVADSGWLACYEIRLVVLRVESS